MSCIQATSVCKPSVYFPNRAKLQSTPSTALCPSLTLPYKQRAPQLKCRQQKAVVCLLGGKDKSEEEGSPWKDFSKVMGNLSKEQSIEDVLRRQMEKQEFNDGNGGKNPPHGGGGGGGGGNGESGEEGNAGIMDETVQVILASVALVLVYIYIITGEELVRLAKDYIKYLFGGSKSVRLRTTMEMWERFWNKLREKVYDKFWLERAIINTTTWYDGPEKYRRVLRNYMGPEEYRRVVRNYMVSQKDDE